MSYELGFIEAALREWHRLDSNTRKQFKKKLIERCDNPHVQASKLSGAKNRYKIKLRGAGYRLVYEVQESQVRVIVVTVGKRERGTVYRTAGKRRL